MFCNRKHAFLATFCFLRLHLTLLFLNRSFVQDSYGKQNELNIKQKGKENLGREMPGISIERVS